MILPDFLTQDPDGEIRLTGHRIGLYTIMRCYKEGYSAERIAEEFPTLPLDLVQQVISFALANWDEVDAYVEEYRAELERQEAEHVPGPGAIRIQQLMKKLQQADALYGSDPSWTALPLLEKVRRMEMENGTEAV